MAEVIEVVRAVDGSGETAIAEAAADIGVDTTQVQAWRNGSWVPDPLVHDDQAIVLHVRDKGLVVLTGCGHAGIVNIVRHAKRLTGVDRVYAVLGGFHLRSGPIIPQTVSSLAAERPEVGALRRRPDARNLI